MAVYNEIKDFLKRVPNHPDSNKVGIFTWYTDADSTFFSSNQINASELKSI